MISREMNSIEIKVLNLIINKGNFEKPITANGIRGKTGLSKRQLEQVIESLRVNFGHPIVAKKRNLADTIFLKTRKKDRRGWHHTDGKS